MRGLAFLSLIASLLALTPPAKADSLTIANYQGAPDHSGRYVVPGLTWATAPTAHLTPGFSGVVQGNMLAQPLYWHPAGATHGLIVVATSTNTVQALDPVTGSTVWQTSLGQNVPGSGVACSGAGPYGVDGTPVIDDAAGALYVAAITLSAHGVAQYQVFGLSLSNGAMLPGWPVNIGDALRAKGLTFTPRIQDQRGALALVGGQLYVPFGGNGGDCYSYHGWVIGLNVAAPAVSGVWQTRGLKGGIWGPGGVSYDGASLFVGTGNTVPRSPQRWDDGVAVVRLRPDLQHSNIRQDFFTPANWDTLDTKDLDLGGTAPIPIDVPTSQGTVPWVLALGKDGNAYVLDRANLGGIGGNVLTQRVASSLVITAPATYSGSSGLYVAFRGNGDGCPPPATNTVLTAIKISAQPAPAISTAWCASFVGTGSPSVTTSDGVNDPVVWMLGAEGDQLLHGFNMITGQPLFSGGGIKIPAARRFATILPAEGHLFVPGGGHLFSFSFGP